MKKIWKYEVGRDGQVATLEGNFVRILSIQAQGPNIYVWMECDDDAPTSSIDIVAIGTGWEIPNEQMEGLTYVNSVIDGPYVWHYYWGMTLSKEEKDSEEKESEEK